jgi:hypothetical protein
MKKCEICGVVFLHREPKAEIRREWKDPPERLFFCSFDCFHEFQRRWFERLMREQNAP